MADDLSLLFRLRAENTQAKAVLADTRASVAQLRQSFGPQLSQTVTVTNKAFSDLGDNLNNFVAQRVPLVGGAIVRVTEGLKGLGNESPKSAKALSTVAASIHSIATQSGKSIPQISSFLSGFVKLETQAAKNDAAFKFFGGSVDLVGNKTAKFIPELEKASTALAEVSAESAAAGTSIAGIAGPIALGVLALAAIAAAAVVVTKEIFALAKASADYQGKLFDLSQQVGVSVETLSALEVVARTTGSSVEALAQSLGIFQKNLEEASQDADSKAAKAFKKLGVETTDTETALRQTIAALARMPEGFRQTAAALEVFGRGGKAFLAIAKEANGDIDEITRKLKDLGLVTTDQARLADEFNDQLVLLEIQLRGLGTEAIPVVLGVLKDLSKALADNRDLVTFLQGGIKGLAVAISIPLLGQLSILKTTFETLLPVLRVSAETLERIAAALGFIKQNPFQSVPSGTETPPVDLGEDDFRKQQQTELASRQKLQGVLNFDFAAQQRQAQASIAQAQRDFEAGQKTRQELLEATIAGIRKQTKAQIDALEVDRGIKLREQALAKDDEAKQIQISNQILAIDTQIADKRHQLREREKEERAKFRQEEENNELAHQQRLLERATALDQVKITGIQQQVALRKKAALDGDKEIEAIELTAIDRAQNLLVKRLALAGLDVAKQKEIKDEIARLDVERRAVEQRHSNERLLIVSTEADVTLQLIQVKGESLIATTEALAQRRIITEEEAERRIAKIKLEALDAEIELAKARGQDTRLLEAQREQFQAQTERNVEEGRQRDLNNERRYADELEKIRERTARIERDTARTVIDLMVLNFARREDVIKAQLELELRDAATRHKRIADGIKQDQLDTDARIRFLTNFISALKAAGKETSKEHEKAVDELRAANARKAELHTEEKSELEKSEKEKLRIRTEAAKDLALAGPGGGLISGLESGQLAELQNGVQSFADVATVAFSAVGAVVNQLASGIGSLVQNFVLLGSNGPNAFRKLVASVLAGVAAQAATLAIMELAYGIAALTPWGAAIYGPAPFHFKSAALFGSVALATGLAGRGVAGGLFQPGGTGGAGDGAESPRDLNPLNLQRNAGGLAPEQQAPIIRPIVTVNIVPDGSKFANAVTAHVVEDFNNAGPIREVSRGDGNLNRG